MALAAVAAEAPTGICCMLAAKAAEKERAQAARTRLEVPERLVRAAVVAAAVTSRTLISLAAMAVPER